MSEESSANEMKCNSVTTDFLNLFCSHAQKSEKTDDNVAPAPDADCYDMTHTRRGIAVIFNHVNFSLPDCPKRNGSDKDCDDLIEMLSDLGFEVLNYNDLRYEELVGALQQVSQMNHSESDCLVIVVMTYGRTDTLSAKDQEYSTKTLWQYFTAQSCPSLAGKPKLLFIEASGGKEPHPSHSLRYSTRVESDSVSNDISYTIPVMADILIMYSTVEGFTSWRDPINGSYFIQSLVKQLKEYNTTKDLLTILTFVNREVAVNVTTYKNRHPGYGRGTQMCSIVSMLTRLVYFSQKSNR